MVRFDRELTANYPAYDAYVVTPHDTNDLSVEVRALYIGGAGDVKVDMEGTGTGITFVGAFAGTMLPIRVTRVYSTGTTATNIVALV